MKIGFIGIGVMGESMARHLLKAGNEVHVYNRTKSKTKTIESEGAIVENSVKELATKCEVICTMVGYPSDVREVYFGDAGILQNANKGTYIIDFTTSTPTLAKEIAEEAKKLGLHSLDAPVSGGDIGAKEARLAIMIGGEEKDFEVMKPLFDILGTNIVYQGAAGAGQHTKMCNQIAIASNMIGITEAVVYAKEVGLDPQKVLSSIETGAAGSWSMTNLVPRILQENFEPGFYLKHFVKDMNIALEEAQNHNFSLPGLKLSQSLYKQLEEEGLGDKGTQVLMKWYENNGK